MKVQSMSQIERTTEQWTIHRLNNWFESINLNPPYQRGLVWTLEQKQLLIDTIIQNMDIPKLYWRRVDDPNMPYEVWDGQQRIDAIVSFVRDGFKLSRKDNPEYGDQCFSQLPPLMRQHIWDYTLDIAMASNVSEADVRNMYIRAQKGTPLVAQEIRHAMVSEIGDFVKQMVDHPIFGRYTKVNRRFSHEQLVAQCLQLTIAGRVTTVNKPQLDALYENWKTFDPKSSAAKQLIRVFDFLIETFPEPNHELNETSMFVSLYWLSMQTLASYSRHGLAAHLKEFFHQIQALRIENKMLPLEERRADITALQSAITTGSDGELNITTRHEVLWPLWLAYASPVPLDPKRNYTDDERKAIYRRDNGICHLCGERVDWDDFQADHVTPHSHGGLTTIDNGRTSHSRCNASKGDRVTHAQD